MACELGAVRIGFTNGRKEDAEDVNSGSVEGIISFDCRHLKRLFIRQNRQGSLNYLKSLPSERPLALQAARLATLFPAVPFWTALMPPQDTGCLVEKSPCLTDAHMSSYTKRYSVQAIAAVFTEVVYC